MAGVVLTEEAYRRMVEAVRWVERQRGLTHTLANPAGGVDPVFVRTTSGTADADGNYPGVVCLYSASAGSWQEYSAVKLRPSNGEPLASNTRYPARPSGQTTGGDQLYTVCQYVGTTSGLTVDGTTGSPHYTGIATLRFNKLGHTLTNSSAGVVDVEFVEASHTASGILTNGVQTIGGGKTFYDAVAFSDTVTFASVGLGGGLFVDGNAGFDGTVNGLTFLSGLCISGTGETGLTGTVP